MLPSSHQNSGTPKRKRAGFWQALRPPAIEDDPAVRDAKQFKDTYKVEENKNYDWVYSYAKENYERLIAANRVLDDKAAEIIRYLGGATGLASVGLIASMKPENVGIFFLLIPAFATSLFAILLALLARKPQQIPHPPATSDVFRMASAKEDEVKAKAELIGSWNLAQKELAAVMDIKAHRIELATKMIVATLILLFVVFAALLVRFYFYPCSLVLPGGRSEL